jgi:TPR repeat protein
VTFDQKTTGPMTYITLSTAVSITGLSKRTLWRRIADGCLHTQGGTDQGEHTRIMLDEVIALSRLRLEPEDHALILKADAGFAEAQCDLALLFLAQNLSTEVVQWLTLAAKQHYPEAMHQLGRCYIAGHGVEANEALGTEWISRAAALGHSTAKHMVHYLMSPGREALEPEALETRLDQIEKNVVLSVLRETTHPA